MTDTCYYCSYEMKCIIVPMNVVSNEKKKSLLLAIETVYFFEKRTFQFLIVRENLGAQYENDIKKFSRQWCPRKV